MAYESQEQLRHDWINLQRIVKYLEGAVLDGGFNSHRGDAHIAWLNANKTQTTLAHAQGLLEKVKESQPSSSYNDVQTALDRMQKIVGDAKNDLYTAPPRARPLLSTRKLPRITPPALKTEPPQSIPEAELLPSEEVAALSPAVLTRDDPFTGRTAQPSRPTASQEIEETSSRGVGAPTRPAFLTTSLETQEELSAQLAQMGHQLKLNAIHLANSLAKEKGVIEGAGEKLENNLGNMTKERVRLRDHSSKSGYTTWMWLGVIACVITAWIAMFFVIRIT